MQEYASLNSCQTWHHHGLLISDLDRFIMILTTSGNERESGEELNISLGNNFITSDFTYQQHVGEEPRFDQARKAVISESSASVVVIELKGRSLRIVLFLEKALIPSSALKWFRTATCMSCLSQNWVEVRISLGQLRIALLYMSVSWEILSGKVRAQVIKLRTGPLISHGEPVLEGILTNSGINRVSSSHGCLLFGCLSPPCHRHSPMIATSRWTDIIILLNKAASYYCPWNASYLRLKILVKLALWSCLYGPHRIGRQPRSPILPPAVVVSLYKVIC